MAREVRVAILGDSRDYNRAVDSAVRDSDRLDRSFSKVSDGASRMGRNVALAATAGIAIGATAVASFIKAAEEAQQVSRQTQAVIRSMGNASNVSAEQVARLAERLSLATAIDDELIQSGQNVLLTFGKVRNELGRDNQVFDRATEAALNMSVALGTDMNSAAMLVGKALNDPIRGLTALRRSGIQFTEEQTEQIRVMVESGDTMGAQKLLLEELERQFGGSAEAQATASGKIAVAWDNIKEQIGTALLPAFEAAATWLTDRLPAAMTWAGGFVDGLLQKWEAFTTVLFGEEDWESFWQDVSAGWTDAGVKWDEFTADLKRGWDEFTQRVFGTNEWDEFWADVQRGWQVVQIQWDEFTGNIAEGWRILMHRLDEYTEPFITTLQGIIDMVGMVAEKVSAVGRFFGIGGGDQATADYLNSLTNPSQPRRRLPPPPSFTGIGPVPIGTPHFAPAPLTPIVGQFQEGGIVPGPRGARQLAVVHGGETILPTHNGGGITLNVYGEPDDFTLRRLRHAAVEAADAVRRSQAWSVS